jgi:hypothetical protein
MSVPCPFCKRQVAFNAYVAGKVVECPWCRNNVRMPMREARPEYKRRQKPARRDAEWLFDETIDDGSEEVSLKTEPCPSCQRQIAGELLTCAGACCPYCHEPLPLMSGAIPEREGPLTELSSQLREMMKIMEADERNWTRATYNVAEWMSRELDRLTVLQQRYAVSEIQRRFGNRFVYRNRNGNLAIHKDVLRAFREVTNGTAIWDRDYFCWTKLGELY